MAENLYSCQEVADMFKVKVDTIYKWIKRGKIEVTRFGFRRYVFTEAQLTLLKGKAFVTVGGATYDEGSNR